MLILTNSLAQKVDEGCLKLANSLVKRIKAQNPQTHIVTYDRKSELSDEHLSINKFLISSALRRILKAHRAPVLYIPFPSAPWKTALKIFMLSIQTKSKLSVAMVMRSSQSAISRILLRMSRADLITFSAESFKFYSEALGESRVHYIKAGVDSQVFTPVDENVSRSLKLKYGINPDKPVVLHVGHFQEGRNLRELLKISDSFQVLLVTSAFNKDNHNLELRETLMDAPNIKVIDTYIPNIEEIYQLSDVYFFPVVAECNCIDIPLSCMEAAACNKPVVTTEYGEMKEFRGKSGFYYIESFEKEALNNLLSRAVSQKEISPRCVALSYDWDKAVGYFC